MTAGDRLGGREVPSQAANEVLRGTVLVTGNKGKLVIRRLMGDRVPPGHFDRPKRGFNLPIRQWLRQYPRLLDGALDRLADAGLIRRPRWAHFKGEQAGALLVLDRWLTESDGM